MTVMDPKHILRSTCVLLAAAAATTVTGGAAYAVWTSTGTGSGAAQATGFIQPVVAPGTTTAQLYPGITGATLSVTATNPNPFAVTVTLASSGPVTSTDPLCDGAGTGVTYSGGSFSVPASTVTPAPFTTAGVSMSNASVNACQNETFTIPLSVSAVSS